MTKPLVYLAGLISTDFTESLEWRIRITPRIKEIGFGVLNPLRGKMDSLSASTSDGGISTRLTSSKFLLLRDRNDVKASAIVLANLNLFGSPRPLLGTIAELAWCYDQQTPVIGIANDSDYLMHNHPFMKEFIAQFVATEDEALRFLEIFYGQRVLSYGQTKLQ